MTSPTRALRQSVVGLPEHQSDKQLSLESCLSSEWWSARLVGLYEGREVCRSAQPLPNSKHDDHAFR
jgi:hypothetical protein